MGFYEAIDFKELLRLDQERKRPISGSAVDQLIHRHLFDVRHTLESALEDAKYDLVHGSDREKKKAAHKIEVLCDLLYAPSNQDGQKRKRGRPSTDAVQNAIHALSLYRKGKGTLGAIKKKSMKKWPKRRLGAPERMDWYEIAMQVIGCKHKGSTATRSCRRCGDKIERAVSRLNQRLEEIGIDLPDVPLPRTFKELDKEIAKMKPTR
jgi:hypothetical protein